MYFHIDFIHFINLHLQEKKKYFSFVFKEQTQFQTILISEELKMFEIKGKKIVRQIRNQHLIITDNTSSEEISFRLKNIFDSKEFTGKMPYSDVPKKYKDKMQFLNKLTTMKPQNLKAEYINAKNIRLHSFKLFSVNLQLQQEKAQIKQQMHEHKGEKDNSQFEVVLDEFVSQSQDDRSEDIQTVQVKTQDFKKQKRIDKQLHECYDELNKKMPVINKKKFPYKSIFQIKSTFFIDGKQLNSYGTGSLITPFHILTCAHNIFNEQIQATCNQMVIKGFGVDCVRVIGYRFNPEYQRRVKNQEEQSQFDYAVLLLESPILYPTFDLLANFKDKFIAEIPGYPFKHASQIRMFKGYIYLAFYNANIGDNRIKQGQISVQNFQTEMSQNCNVKNQMKINQKMTIKIYENNKSYDSMFKGSIIYTWKYSKTHKQFQIDGIAKGVIQGEIQGPIQSKINGKLIGSMLGKRRQKFIQNKYQYNDNFYKLQNAQNRLQLQKFEENIIRHKISSAKGQSGSPLLIEWQKSKFYIIGIHVANDKQMRENMAVRLSYPIIQTIRRYCGQLYAQFAAYIQLFLTPIIKSTLILKITDYQSIKRNISQNPGFSLIDPNHKLQNLLIEAQILKYDSKYKASRKLYNQMSNYKNGYKNDEIVKKIIEGTCNNSDNFIFLQKQRNQIFQIKQRNGAKIGKEKKHLHYAQGKKMIKSDKEMCIFIKQDREYYELLIEIKKQKILFEQQGNKYGKHKRFENILKNIDEAEETSLKKYDQSQQKIAQNAKKFIKLRYDCHIMLGLAYADKRKMFRAYQQYLKAEEILKKCDEPAQQFLEVYHLIFTTCLFEFQKVQFKLTGQKSSFKIGIDYVCKAFILLNNSTDKGQSKFHDEIMNDFAEGTKNLSKYSKDKSELSYGLSQLQQMIKDVNVLKKLLQNSINLLKIAINKFK